MLNLYMECWWHSIGGYNFVSQIQFSMQLQINWLTWIKTNSHLKLSRERKKNLIVLKNKEKFLGCHG